MSRATYSSLGWHSRKTLMPAPDFERAIQAHSHRVEAILKHALLWRLYSELWQRQPNTKVVVFESEIDDSGFDVVVSVGAYTRHIQLKSSMMGSSTKSVNAVPVFVRITWGLRRVDGISAIDTRSSDIQRPRLLESVRATGLPQFPIGEDHTW